MSYHEKRAFLGLGTLLLVVVSYCIYAFSSYANGNTQNDNIKFWAGAILLFIAVGVIITVITEIILYIREYLKISADKNLSKASVTQKMKTISNPDEMDKLIELKTSKISYEFTGIGFVSAMILVLIGFSASVMINIIFLSMCVGSFIEGIAVIYYYKVGVSNE